MKINLLKEFKQLNGDPLQDGEVFAVDDIPLNDPKAKIDWKRTKKLNLQSVICLSLGSRLQGSERGDVMKSWKLAEKCHGNNEVDLKSEEIVMIKDAIFQYKHEWTVLIIAQSEDMLENTE